MHNAMKKIPSENLRWPITSEKPFLFSVSFSREEGIDFGGIFRETVERR